MSSEAVKEFPLEEEYKKKTQIRPEDISKFRQWLTTQPHLPAEAITDLELILTFHCCNRSSEVSKQVLDLHFTLRTLFDNFFKNRRADEKTLAVMENYLILPLEARAYDESKIIYCRLMNYDVKNFIFHEGIRTILMTVDLWQHSEGTWPGLHIAVDMDRVSVSHLTRLDIQTMQQFFLYLQEAMLVKLKALHFLNAPAFMDRLMMLMRPFMKKELLSMLHIHQGGSRTIDKFLPMEALPKEAGGQDLDIQAGQAEYLSKIRNGADYFLAENNKRVTEAKRPGKPKTISDIFGSVEGSFKKLDID